MTGGQAGGAAAAAPPPRRRQRKAPGAAVLRGAGARRAPRSRRVRAQIAYLAVLGGAAAALAWMWQGAENVRGGTLALAGALSVAAVVRLALPETLAGMLVTRSRAVDVATLAVLAAGLLAVGLVLPTGS